MGLIVQFSDLGKHLAVHGLVQRYQSKALFVALGAILTIFLATPLALSYHIPSDVALKSKVLREEGVCPPDQWGSYGFDVALEGKLQARYAAACGSGPRNVLIQLPTTSRLRWIDFHEYASSEQWTGFGVYSSMDQQTWDAIYSTNYGLDQKAQFQRISSESFRLSLPDVIKTRYVRIEYRTSNGQNRMLLKKLAIYVE